MECRKEIRPGRTLNLVIHQHPNSNKTAFLIHGLGGYGNQWRKQLDILKNEFTLIIPDLMGHGKSDKPVSGQTNLYSFSELDQDIQALFNLYATENNIVLGHSYGGALAASLTLDHQEKIQRFILIAPTPCTANLPIPLVYHLPAIVMQGIRPYLERKFQHLAFTPNADLDLLAHELKANQLNPIHVIKSLIYGMRAMPSIDLTMLNTPGLIIVGDPDHLVSPTAQQLFYKNLPHHQFEIIANASHMVLLEKPEAVNQSIINFLHH